MDGGRDVAIGAAESFAGYVDLVHGKAYESKGGKEVERVIRAEAAEVRKAFGEVLGNNPPPDPTKTSNGAGT